MTKLPEYLSGGEIARLIPVTADSNKEQRATSILLAAFRGVYEFRRVMLDSLGIKVGNRATLHAWTEVCFKLDPKIPKSDRPDGLVVLDTGTKKGDRIIFFMRRRKISLSPFRSPFRMPFGTDLFI